MKRCLYYITPFVLIPVVMLLSEYMDNMDLIPMSPYILFAELAVSCIVIGNLSPTNKNFDYIITLIMPLSLFCMMFIAGFLDRGCSGELAFSPTRACEVACQPLGLVAYCVMALITFLASFKPIRISNRLNHTKKFNKTISP